ncbi:hypothetical protein AB5N19_02981 [Seiridium cardinale]
MQRPKTPEERSHARVSDNPVESQAKFEVERAAWIVIPKKGACEIKIVARRKEHGKYVYQVKGSDGVLYKDGAWVAQEKLREA